MKRIFFLLITLIITSNVLHAQVMSAKPIAAVIKSENLKCWECKEALDKWLIIQNKATLENGIAEWKINVKTGEIKLKYFAERTSIEDIRTIIVAAGFDADNEKAEPEAYKKLPSACKRAVDGGGPKKGAPCREEPY